MPPAQRAETGKPADQSAVFAPPWVGGAVEGIFKALHAGFVAVIERRRAGEGIEQHGGKLYALHAARVLGGGEPEVRALVPRFGRFAGKTEDGQQSRRVVGGEKIHGAVKRARRIVFAKRFHGVFKIRRVAAAKIGQGGGAERIVHQRVRFAAEKVLAAPGVGDLVRAVLPDLADEQAVGAFFVHCGADRGDKFIGQLIGDVQPPAGGAQTQPAAHDGIGTGHHIVYITFVRLLDGGQIFDAPPGIVIVRKRVETIPVIIRRTFPLGGAGRGIKAVGVEIDAFCARVIEHAVEDHADAASLCLGTERFEILLRAEQRVDVFIIRGVVAVVGGRFKNGVEVECGDAERHKVIQLLRDAGKVAAEKVGAGNLAVRVGTVFHRLVPGFMQRPAADKSRGAALFRAEKAIGKDLIGDAAGKPAGRFPAAVIDGQLPRRDGIPALVPACTVAALAAVRPKKAKVVPHQLRRIARGIDAAENGVFPFGGGGKLRFRPAVRKLAMRHQHDAPDGRGIGTEAESDGRPAGDGAKGSFISFAAGIKKNS